MSFKKELKKVMIKYPDVQVTSSKDYRDLINLHNIVESWKGEDLELVKEAFEKKEKLETLNDYYYLVFKTASNSGLKKRAYPQGYSLTDLPREYDLDKWANLVYKIYDAVSSHDMNIIEATDYYASSLDKKSGEDIKFKQWMKYYQDGEHLKYSDKRTNEKTAAYQFGLVGPDSYGSENGSSLGSDFYEKFKTKVNSKDDFGDWKNKLYTAIRRIDKLLRVGDDYIDSETQRELADLLHNFDLELRSIRFNVTASDLAFKYANKFKKLGFSEPSNELIKIAQEIPQEPIEDVTDESLENREDVPEPQPELHGSDKQPKSETSSEGGVNESAIERAFSGNTGGKDEEYGQLAGDVSLQETITKLEEIAGRLSDRRTIRLLAEFDIMLDKIGIAPMFPELAEAQSKLIDAYSYSLTRVTKMLGMLSSGKSLVEISDAKKREINDGAMKAVEKTFNPEEKPEGPARGEEAISEQASRPEEVAPKAPAVETPPVPEV